MIITIFCPYYRPELKWSRKQSKKAKAKVNNEPSYFSNSSRFKCFVLLSKIRGHKSHKKISANNINRCPQRSSNCFCCQAFLKFNCRKIIIANGQSFAVFCLRQSTAGKTDSCATTASDSGQYSS